VRGQIGKEEMIEYKYVYPSTDKYRMNEGEERKRRRGRGRDRGMRGRDGRRTEEERKIEEMRRR
jgi:hypothetical protein